MLSPEDALKRIAARYDMENHYFAQPEEWIYEIKTGVKFEVHKYGHKLIDHHMPYKQGQLTVFVRFQYRAATKGIMMRLRIYGYSPSKPAKAFF